MRARREQDSKSEKRTGLYLDGFIAAIPSVLDNDKALERAIFYGVKYMGRAGESTTIEELGRRFSISEALMALIAMVTPRRFVEIFPINKEYDGERWGLKDYFYTVEMITKHGWDKPIGESSEGAFGFLWDYQNWDINLFLVNHMSLVSEMARSQGQPGPMEQWAAENGIQIYTLNTTPDGKQYLLDSNGRSTPVRKKRPRHLRLMVPKRRRGQ
ncbi:hypothetical protein [Brevibacillus parabrevis]|uniref:hypothetical protein n=1 Tax=Brevibacillus parabrevis TaxID=54914 RepID=UPI00285311D9|nr:hypothetical protein [Brevibacillus parabrevis]MDR4997873.1 hypothetical protein [Brevibacillus parabrevis]